jgi:hypothetical protein
VRLPLGGLVRERRRTRGGATSPETATPSRRLGRVGIRSVVAVHGALGGDEQPAVRALEAAVALSRAGDHLARERLPAVRTLNLVQDFGGGHVGPTYQKAFWTLVG